MCFNTINWIASDISVEQSNDLDRDVVTKKYVQYFLDLEKKGRQLNYSIGQACPLPN